MSKENEQYEDQEKSNGPLPDTEQQQATGQRPKFSPAALAILSERGITVETAIRAGIRLYGSAAEAAEILGRKGGHEYIPVPGLVIPYQGCPGYAKLRPNRAEIPDPKHKPIHGTAADYIDDVVPMVPTPKYLCPKGKGAPVYFPFGPDDPLLKEADAIWIVEGEWKALALRQLAIAAVAIQGVQNGMDPQARWEAKCEGRDLRVLAEGLQRLGIAGNSFVLSFDNDVDENGNVLNALMQLGTLLRDGGAEVEIAYLPASRDKVGLDDHLAVAEPERSGRLEALHDSCRPFNVDKVIDWLEGKWDDMNEQVQKLELSRATKLARVMLKKADYKKWLSKAEKIGALKSAQINALAPEAEILTAEAAYSNFGTAKILEHCIPVLNESFALLRAADGTERYFSVNVRREVSLLSSLAPMEQVLHDHLKHAFGQIPPRGVLTEAISLWKKECPRLGTEPQPFCFEGDERLCFKRFDWQPTAGFYPAWEEFLDRLTDRKTFMAFIWSCFEPKNVGRQYLWLQGEGQDGKSVVLGVLAEIFGPAATGISIAHTKPGQFLYSAFYGKRLVTYADCKNTKFGMTELVRNITSGDPVLVEFKNQTPFSCSMRVKLIVASNPKPEVSSQNSDRSRMLYMEVAESKTKDDPTWRSRLMEELPGFLWMCRSQYNQQCPRHGDLPVPDSVRLLQEDRATSFEQKFHDFFEDRFVVIREAKLAAKTVLKMLHEAKFTDNEIGDFKQWMERVHGIKSRRTSQGRWYENLDLADWA